MTTNPHLRINSYGCGRVGQTLLRLWQRSNHLTIGDVLTRSQTSADEAVAMIGAGRATTALTEFKSADIYLIASTDDAIGHCAKALADSGLLSQHSIVFHCSGALSSKVLEPCQKAGAKTASIHPVKNFASAVSASDSFNGTCCGTEGDTQALEVLIPLFGAIGGQCFSLQPEHKTLYHAASVMASNYLVALQQHSLELFAAAGVSNKQACQILAPLTHGTLDNVFTHGSAQALTGPIARGDIATVRKQLNAVTEFNTHSGDTYRLLGIKALQIAQQKDHGNASGLKAIAELLQSEDVANNSKPTDS